MSSIKVIPSPKFSVSIPDSHNGLNNNSYIDSSPNTPDIKDDDLSATKKVSSVIANMSKDHQDDQIMETIDQLIDARMEMKFKSFKHMVDEIRQSYDQKLNCMKIEIRDEI